MDYESYRIQREEKLEDLARQIGISVEKLQELNPQMETFKNFWGTETFVAVNQMIKVPIKIKKRSYGNENLDFDFIKSQEEREARLSEQEKFLRDLTFDQQARYRCEQVNISKVNGNMVHFVEQKFQYLLKNNLDQKIGYVKLEEHLYNFSPPILNLSFEFISKTEFIKNNVFFNISSDNGRIEKIIQRDQLNKRWVDFRNKDFDTSDFIKRLQQTNTKAVEELKSLGDKQFSIHNKQLEEEFRRNLFYFCCFDKFLLDIENIPTEEFFFMSTIVPPIIVPIQFRYDKISEENNIFKLRKVGTLKLNPQLIKEIEKKYDEMHKPNIKYGFTEYKIEFRTRIEYNIKEKLVETADVFIMEQIADNIDNTCEFHLKRLQNFKP